MAVAYLVSLCAAMTISTIIIGLIPLTINLHPRTIPLLAVYGSGLLLGAALTLILPEGVDALYSSPNPDNASRPSQLGITLLLGFLTMLLVDFLSPNSSSSHTSSSSTPCLHHDDINLSHSSQSSSLSSHPHPLALALIIHSLADGIALGASLSLPTNHVVSLGFLVFFAILAHKSPAALGLVSILLAHGQSPSSARKSLFLFALAAPVAALLTYLLIFLLDRSPESLQHWTSLCLIYSAGTMLFVAAHVLSLSTSASSKSTSTSSLNLALLILGIVTPGFLQLLISPVH